MSADKRGDAFIADLLNWTRRLSDATVEAELLRAAREYRASLLWKTIPVRLPDSIDCPPVSGEFEAK